MRLFLILMQRLALGMVTVVAVSMLIFACVSILPGDFASNVLGQAATEETVAAFRQVLGLDRPFVLRYWDWVSNAAQGDLGYSFTAIGSQTLDPSRSVSALLGERLYNTLFLAGLAAAAAVPVAVALGVTAVIFRGGHVDRLITVMSISAISVPEFLVSYILIVFLAIQFPIFHAMSYVTHDMPLTERLARCALPAFTLFIPVVGHMARMTRASLMPILSSAYIETARLKGMSNLRIILSQALPNAWAPIVAVVALNMAYLVVGAVVVEVVFVYPGVGQMMVDSVAKRDIPVVLACALIFSVVYIACNLLADLIAIASNPRLLHPR